MPTRIETGKICVYHHAIGGDVFYVGRGDAPRAFSAAQRNARWRSIFRSAGHFDAHIIGWYTPDEAKEVEEEEIKRLRPRANIHIAGETREQSGFKRTGSVDQIVAALSSGPRTIEEICVEVYGVVTQRNRNVIRVNLHRLDSKGALVKYPMRFSTLE